MTQDRRTRLIARMKKAGVLNDPCLTSTWLRDRVFDHVERRTLVRELHPKLVFAAAA